MNHFNTKKKVNLIYDNSVVKYNIIYILFKIFIELIIIKYNNNIIKKMNRAYNKNFRVVLV